MSVAWRCPNCNTGFFPSDNRLGSSYFIFDIAQYCNKSIARLIWRAQDLAIQILTIAVLNWFVVQKPCEGFSRTHLMLVNNLRKANWNDIAPETKLASPRNHPVREWRRCGYPLHFATGWKQDSLCLPRGSFSERYPRRCLALLPVHGVVSM